MPVEIRSTQLSTEEWAIVDQFHTLVYAMPCRTSWLGYPVIKWPGDLWNYQMLLWLLKPDTLIECGTALGGSALFFASVMESIGHGQVISIDIEGNVEKICDYMRMGPEHRDMIHHERPRHSRITYLTGNTVDPHLIDHVTHLTKGKTMVVLDSAHDADHVLEECQLYAPLVTPQSYLIIEDANSTGHPVPVFMGEAGPYEAAITFLAEAPQFRWDIGLMEHYFFSYNAWLMRVD